MSKKNKAKRSPRPDRRGSPRKSRGSQAAFGSGTYGTASDLEHGSGREVTLEIPAAPKDVTIDREALPPSLQGLSDDDQFPIIIATGDDPPEGAGELIGELKQDLRASDGTILKEGSNVWLDTRTGSLAERASLHSTQGLVVGTPGTAAAARAAARSAADIIASPSGPPATGTVPDVVTEYRQRMAEGAIPAAFRARNRARGGSAGDFVSALEHESEGLAQRLAEGLSPDELAALAPQIARAASISDAPSGQYSFTTGQREPTVVIEGVPDEPVPRFGKRGRGSRKTGQTVADPIPTGRVSAQPAETVPSRVIIGGTRDDGGEGVPGGLQPGDIIAPAQPRGYVPAGIPVPEGAGQPGDQVWRPRVATVPSEELRHELGPVTRAVLAAVPHREPGDPAILALRASDVLDMHAQLTDLMARPTEEITRYYTRFLQQAISQAHESGGAEAAREHWEGMFWPATNSREWTSILARLLSQARTYQITAEMVEKVTAQYADDLATGEYVIDHDDLPWPAGFAWLDAPLTFTDKFGREGWNRVVTWGPEILQPGRRRVPGSRIVTFSWHDDHDGWWTEESAAGMLRQGGLAMAHAITFPYNARLNVTRDRQGRATQDDTIRWTRTLWRTLSSEIAATRTDSHIERHVAKRALRSLRHNQVHVVTLRRKFYVTEGNGHRDVRWTCQWPVNGFWRHARRDEQWEDTHIEHDENGRRTRHHAVPDEFKENCAICGAKVSWIGTFTKGPPGAPWRDQSNRTLHRLSR